MKGKGTSWVLKRTRDRVLDFLSKRESKLPKTLFVLTVVN